MSTSARDIRLPVRAVCLLALSTVAFFCPSFAAAQHAPLVLLSMNSVFAEGSSDGEGEPDNIRPTGTLTAAPKNPVHAAISVNLTLSEFCPVLTSDAFTLTNAAISELSGASGTQFSFALTPLAPGPFSVSIVANTFFDGAGNGNVAIAELRRHFVEWSDEEGEATDYPEGEADVEILTSSSVTYLGGSVAIDGDRLVAGSAGDGIAFERTGNSWISPYRFDNVHTPLMVGQTQNVTIVGFEAAQVDLVGDEVIIGSPAILRSLVQPDGAYIRYNWKDSGIGYYGVQFNNGQASRLGERVALWEWNGVVRYAVSEPLQKKLITTATFALPHLNVRSISARQSQVVLGCPEEPAIEQAEGGSAYVYSATGTGWNLSHPELLSAEDILAADEFGADVAVHERTVLVGAPGKNAGAGAVYVFVQSETGWTLQTSLIAADTAAGDHFGISVALWGETAIVGAPDADVGSNTNTGAAYVFRRNNGSWAQIAKIVLPDASGSERFGFDVDSSATDIAVGAPNKMGDLSLQPRGAVYVFTGGFINEAVRETPEGASEGEGVVEGATEGTEEGLLEGTIEGVIEGANEGAGEGTVEGTVDGEEAIDGSVDGSPPVPVNYYAFGDYSIDTASSIATDDDGNWMVAWTSGRARCGGTGASEIYVSRSTDNGLSWGQTRVVTKVRYSNTKDQPRVLYLGSGRWGLFWYEDPNSIYNRILFSFSEDLGVTWSNPSIIYEGDVSGAPSVATDKAGRLHAVWVVPDRFASCPSPYLFKTLSSIFQSKSIDGGTTWTPVNRIGLGKDPSIQTDGRNNWYLLSTQLESECESKTKVLVRTLRGDTWTPYSQSVAPPSNDNLNEDNLVAGIDSSGRLVCSWSKEDRNLVVGSGYDFDRAESYYKRITGEHDNASSSKPVIVGDGRGNWVMVWSALQKGYSDDASFDYDIFYSVSTNNAASWTQSKVSQSWDQFRVDRKDSAPAVATDHRGHWVVTWTSTNNFGCDSNTDADIHSSTFTLGEVIETGEESGTVDSSTECDQAEGDSEGDPQVDLRPSVRLSSQAPSAVNRAIPVTVTVSEFVPNFVPESLTLSNASVSEFMGNEGIFSGTAFTFLLHPIEAGIFSVRIEAGRFSDVEFQQGNLPSNVLSRSYVPFEDWHAGFDGELDLISDLQKLTQPAKHASRFGRSVAVSGDTLFAGNDKASAPYFDYDGDSWVSSGEVAGEWLLWDAQPGFTGFDVDILGDNAIVGAPFARHFNPEINEPDGVAITYTRTPGSSDWLGMQAIAHGEATPGKETGYSVAAGEFNGVLYHVVGMPNMGSAYFRTKTSTEFNILPSPNPFPGDRFGCSVAAWQAHVVIGADASQAASELAEGSAYVIHANDGVFPENTCPSYGFKLSVPGLQRADLFGADVAIHEGTVLVGAPGESYGAGAVYVFRLLGNQVDWLLTSRLAPPDAVAGDAFGTSVSFFGDTAVIGAPGQDEAAVDAGAAYVFRTDGETWDLLDKLLAPDADAGDGFGTAVDNGVANIVVGAPGDDESGLDAGAVYAYRGGQINYISQESGQDLTRPLPTLSCAAGDVVNAPVRVTLHLGEFLESVVPLILETENATCGEFSSFNGEEFSFLLTPRAPGAFSVSVPADRFTDAAENLNLASNVVTRVYETPTDGEGVMEGEVPDGAVDGEVIVEGTPEGLPEGLPEGTVDGAAEGVEEGAVEGVAEGTLEGGGESEGEGEGEGLIEGIQEGEGEGEVSAARHSLDTNANSQVDLNELLRVIQLYNSGAFGCALDTEDGYAPDGADIQCTAHSGDYNPQDWKLSLSELLRIVQLYNVQGFAPCAESEDGFCPVQ